MKKPSLWSALIILILAVFLASWLHSCNENRNIEPRETENEVILYV